MSGDGTTVKLGYVGVLSVHQGREKHIPNNTPVVHSMSKCGNLAERAIELKRGYSPTHRPTSNLTVNDEPPQRQCCSFTPGARTNPVLP